MGENLEVVGNWYDQQCEQLDIQYQHRLSNVCTILESIRVDDWYALQKNKIFNEWLRRAQA